MTMHPPPCQPASSNRELCSEWFAPALSTAEGTPRSGDAQAFVSGAGERIGTNRSGRSFFADFVFLAGGLSD
jgi:hypothetical protein